MLRFCVESQKAGCNVKKGGIRVVGVLQQTAPEKVLFEGSVYFSRTCWNISFLCQVHDLVSRFGIITGFLCLAFGGMKPVLDKYSIVKS